MKLKQPKLGTSLKDELDEMKVALKDWHNLYEWFVPVQERAAHAELCPCFTCEMRRVHTRQKHNPRLNPSKSR
jgi:hypothetical protein